MPPHRPSPASRHLREAVIGLVAAAVVATAYLAAWQSSPTYDGDSQSYLEMARDFSDGHIDRPHLRAPGYPVFLVLAGALPEPGLQVVVVQILLHCASVALWLVLLRRLRASRLALAGFALIALSPPFVEHARFVLSEAVAEIAVSTAVAGVALFSLGGGSPWLVASATGVVLAGVVHPVYQLLWLVLPSLLLVFRWASGADLPTRKALVRTAVVLAAFTLPLLIVISLRNQERFGFAGVSPMLGATLSHKTARVVELLPDDEAVIREILVRHRNEALLDPGSQHLGHSYIFRALRELREATGLDGPALDRRLVGLNLELIRRAPMDYVDEVLRSQVWFWSPGVTDVSGFGSNALKVFWNGLRAAVLVGFWLSLLLLSGPTLLFFQSQPWGTNARKAARPSLEIVMVLFLCIGTAFYAALVSGALTAAVYRLRIPVDLPILACVVLAPGLWRWLSLWLLRGETGNPEPARGSRASLDPGSRILKEAPGGPDMRPETGVTAVTPSSLRSSEDGAGSATAGGHADEVSSRRAP